MKPLENTALRKAFSHIYIEEAAAAHPRTKAILAHFPNAVSIPIADYKNVFNRPRQATPLQKKAPSLILALGKPPYLYEGAPVCQSFGEEHFFYTSCVRNCPYDCEYCYLQGMYPSGDIVIFVNLEDTLAAVEKTLSKHPLYLCISYDTDLLALDNLTGFLAEWFALAAKYPSLTLELRTKNASVATLAKLPVLPNVILAVTMSPDEVIRRYEHRTPALSERIALAKAALTDGRPVRLCFDPMIAVPDFRTSYGQMFQTIFTALPPEKLRDISVGSFRISVDYLKRMRRNRPCAVTMYPYTLTDGVYHYDEQLLSDMLSFARETLHTYIPSSKIFYWEEQL